MKNSEIWEQYKSYTKDLTEMARKLGFAGVAICWMLKTPEGVLASSVLWALAFYVAFFIADVLQSLSGALLIRGWVRKEEIQRWNASQSLEGDYLKPAWLDYPSFVMFLLKIGFLLMGFVFLALEVFSR